MSAETNIQALEQNNPSLFERKWCSGFRRERGMENNHDRHRALEGLIFMEV